jgi:hypothetical protein
MQCAPCDLNCFLLEIRKLIRDQSIEFFLWKQFHNLLDEKKQTIITAQNHFNGMYRSIMVEGFIDMNTEVNMITKDKTKGRKEEFLESVTITEYITENILSGDGTKLFKMAYPTIMGVKELIMDVHHFEEAKEWADVAHGELARVMNEASIRLVFEDITFAIEESFNDPWQPYHRNKFIATTPASNFRNKRARAATPSKNIILTNSYASAVTQVKPVVEDNITHQNEPTIKPPPPKVHREVIELFDTPIVRANSDVNEQKIEKNDKAKEIDMNAIQKQIAAETARIKDQLTYELGIQLEQKTSKASDVILKRFEKLENKLKEDEDKKETRVTKMERGIEYLVQMMNL